MASCQRFHKYFLPWGTIYFQSAPSFLGICAKYCGTVFLIKYILVVRCYNNNTVLQSVVCQEIAEDIPRWFCHALRTGRKPVNLCTLSSTIMMHIRSLGEH